MSHTPGDPLDANLPAASGSPAVLRPVVPPTVYQSSNLPKAGLQGPVEWPAKVYRKAKRSFLPPFLPSFKNGDSMQQGLVVDVETGEAVSPLESFKKHCAL